MKPRNRRFSFSRILACLAGIAVPVAGLLIPAWLFPGYVECRGYSQPSHWAAFYASSDGIVRDGVLEDGMYLSRGDTVLTLDSLWPEYNLQRVRSEMKSLESEEVYLRRRLELFTAHRNIEAAELHRLAEADRVLAESSSVSRNQKLHSKYLYDAFMAGSDREKVDIAGSLVRNRMAWEKLSVELKLWESRLRECRLVSPGTGVFYASESVFSGEQAAFLPPLGPGRRVEQGHLLGYIVPDESIEIIIYVPVEKSGVCQTGQKVAVFADSTPAKTPVPLAGTLSDLSPLASQGYVRATVELSSAGFSDLLFCGGLTARIHTGNHAATSVFSGLWNRWVLIVNPI